MNYYLVEYRLGSTKGNSVLFSRKCFSAFEAIRTLDIIYQNNFLAGEDFTLDDVMVELIKMKEGNHGGISTEYWGISYIKEDLK